jgi:hypothetical protein
MDEERLVMRQNLKETMRKWIKWFLWNRFYGHKKQFVKSIWTKNRKIHSWYCFATRFPEKYKLADLKP